jgi:hypothetical protein
VNQTAATTNPAVRWPPVYAAARDRLLAALREAGLQ